MYHMMKTNIYWVVFFALLMPLDAQYPNQPATSKP